jgi:hypothetical protein
VNAMSSFLMEFYTPPHGMVVTFDCRTERNYQRVKVFLQHLVGGHCSPGEPERSDPIFIISRTNGRRRRCSVFSEH